MQRALGHSPFGSASLYISQMTPQLARCDLHRDFIDWGNEACAGFAMPVAQELTMTNGLIPETNHLVTALD